MCELNYYKNILNRALKTYGIHAQLDQTIEECAELIVAIRHSQRNDRIDCAQEHQDAIISEIADVQIMLDQLKLVFGRKIVEAEYYKKLNRLEERLKQETSP